MKEPNDGILGRDLPSSFQFSVIRTRTFLGRTLHPPFSRSDSVTRTPSVPPQNSLSTTTYCVFLSSNFCLILLCVTRETDGDGSVTPCCCDFTEDTLCQDNPILLQRKEVYREQIRSDHRLLSRLIARPWSLRPTSVSSPLASVFQSL